MIVDAYKALKAAIPRLPTGLTVAPTQVGEPRSYVSLMTHLEEKSTGPAMPSRTMVDPALLQAVPEAEWVDIFIAIPELSNRLTATLTILL